MKNPEKLARKIIAETESMDYVLGDGDTRLKMVAAIIAPKKQQCPDCPDCPDLIAGWCIHYRGFFGHEYQPAHCDAEATGKLLRHGTVNEILSLATTAWKFRDDRKRPHCRSSVTMSGLLENFAAIQKELVNK